MLILFEKNLSLRIALCFLDGDIGLGQKYLLIPHQIYR